MRTFTKSINCVKRPWHLRDWSFNSTPTSRSRMHRSDVTILAHGAPQFPGDSPSMRHRWITPVFNQRQSDCYCKHRLKVHRLLFYGRQMYGMDFPPWRSTETIRVHKTKHFLSDKPRVSGSILLLNKLHVAKCPRYHFVIWILQTPTPTILKRCFVPPHKWWHFSGQFYSSSSSSTNDSLAAALRASFAFLLVKTRRCILKRSCIALWVVSHSYAAHGLCGTYPMHCTTSSVTFPCRTWYLSDALHYK